MARTEKRDQKKKTNGASVGYEAELWQMADALRGSMDAAEYKHVVLGLIFLKYISDAFEEQHAKLDAERAQGADPEDPDEYRALNIFWVPPEARWSHLKAQAKQPTIGQLVDDAMSGIERDNPSLKGVLPKEYARPTLDKQRLGQLIDMVSNIDVRQPSPPAPLPGGEGHFRGGFDFSGLANQAREMQKNPTPAEEIMWEILREQRFLNLKFRRQHQIGDYVVDFYCHEKRLVVELDGPVHSTHERAKVDQKRDGYLRSQGLTVVRFRNEDLLNNPESVLQRLAGIITDSSPAGRGQVRVNKFRDRRGETLFIDARKLGVLVDRTHRELTDDEITRIARTYHAWRGSPLTSSPSMGEDRDGGEYKDIPGFCKSAMLDEIRKHGHVLTPGRYVGAEVQEDDGEPFEEKMKRLTATLREQQAEAAKLDAAIAANLKELGYGR